MCFNKPILCLWVADKLLKSILPVVCGWRWSGKMWWDHFSDKPSGNTMKHDFGRKGFFCHVTHSLIRWCWSNTQPLFRIWNAPSPVKKTGLWDVVCSRIYWSRNISARFILDAGGCQATPTHWIYLLLAILEVDLVHLDLKWTTARILIYPYKYPVLFVWVLWGVCVFVLLLDRCVSLPFVSWCSRSFQSAKLNTVPAGVWRWELWLVVTLSPWISKTSFMTESLLISFACLSLEPTFSPALRKPLCVLAPNFFPPLHMRDSLRGQRC